MRGSNISPAMREAVGTELYRQVSYPVSESDIRRWAIAVYWPQSPPEYFIDENSAAATEHPGIVAPAEFNPFAWAVAERAFRRTVTDDGPDHLETMAGIAGPGLKFRLNGGIETEYGVPIRPGDIITGVRRLGPYSERDGRLGSMLFGRTDEVWTNQRDEFVKRVVNTVIRY
jgi:N-terminal half of MaoC dehydratase